MEWIEKKYSQFVQKWCMSSKYKKSCIFISVYTILFLFSFVLAFSPFLLEKKSFIWQSDGRTQHYKTLVYIGRYLRQIILNLFRGDFSIPLVDINIALGADIIATLNYYGLGDPLNLLAVIVPPKYIEYLYNFLVVFRIYLAGLAFSNMCVYYRKRVDFTLIGALVYTFSGYAIYSAVRHPFFINPMIQLPFLILGMDKIMQRQRPFVFIYSVFYSALCGFYFLYMMTIILAFYGVIKFFDYYSCNRFKEFGQMAGRIICNYLLGIGLAGIIFLPSVVIYFFSSRNGEIIKRNYFSYGLNWYRNNLLRIVSPPASWAAFGLAAIVLLAIVLLFSIKKRNSIKWLFLSGMFLYLLPLGGYVMNGFSYPASRWTFAMVLLLSYVVVEMLPTLFSLNNKQKFICFTTLLLYTLLIFSDSKTRNVYYVVGLTMLALTFVLLLLFNDIEIIKKNRNSTNSIGVVACLFLVIFNIGINAIYKYSSDQGKYINEFTVYNSETKRLKDAIEREAEVYLPNADGRFDSASFTRNVGMVWHVPTAYFYWSMVDSHTTDLWKETENISSSGTSFNIRGMDERTIMSTLFSTKYFIEKESKLQYVPYGYEFINKTNSKNYVYKNKYALPWGYTYSDYISYDELRALNGLEMEEAMLSHIALEKNIDGVIKGNVKSNIRQIPYEIIEASNLEWTDSVLNVSKANAVLTLSLQLPDHVEGYLRLQGLDINDSGQSSFDVSVKCDNVEKSATVASSLSNWYCGRENYLFNLGYSEEVRTTCTLIFPKKGTYRLDDIQLFALPMDQYPKQVDKLRAEPLENIKFETNRITGTVDLSKNKILCMSIPYSKGWHAKVDGMSVEILRGNIMFIALPLEAGNHEIEFYYCTPGLKTGIVCCLISIIFLIYYTIREKRKKANMV